MNKSYLGWAIELKYDYPALAGIYFNSSMPHDLLALRTLVFRTRNQAREANKTIGGKVVRVLITVETLQEVAA